MKKMNKEELKRLLDKTVLLHIFIRQTLTNIHEIYNDIHEPARDEDVPVIERFHEYGYQFRDFDNEIELEDNIKTLKKKTIKKIKKQRRRENRQRMREKEIRSIMNGDMAPMKGQNEERRRLIAEEIYKVRHRK